MESYIFTFISFIDQLITVYQLCTHCLHTTEENLLFTLSTLQNSGTHSNHFMTIHSL
uniref:Uncharacterized protein n=1 Tax=Anguilla anguilla TaxID=7936 RepID=A0A0E9U3S2_ANGAN